MWYARPITEHYVLCKKEGDCPLPLDMAPSQTEIQPAPVRARITQQRRSALMLGITRMFEETPDKLFNAIRHMEDNEAATRAMPTADSVLEPIVNLLNYEMGIKMDGTVGDLMDVLGINTKQAHMLACFCLGPRVSGREAAERVRTMDAGFRS
jgi:hypothetical protein